MLTGAAALKASFFKYHGLGNDFIVVDADQLPQGALTPAQARLLCDRRFGVGADGVLVLHPSPTARARMVILNADGSRPEMCGNGLRCVAAHLAVDLDGDGIDDGIGARIDAFDVDTDAGLFRCAVQRTPGGDLAVSVGMGRVSFDPALAGVEAHHLDPHGRLHLLADGQPLTLHLASTGNPHAICLVEDPEADLIALAARLGPVAGANPAFARGANVSWARVSPMGLVELVVYERGAGLTLACGTGACAAVASLVRLGLLPAGRLHRVLLPGGALDIEVAPAGHDEGMILAEGGAASSASQVGAIAAGLSGPVIMTGPAQRVFAGAFEALPLERPSSAREVPS